MKPLVYAFSGAPRPWRAMLGLVFKNIDFDVHWVQNSKQEHKSVEFLKLNPRATLPVLICDDQVITDSIGILAWLDNRFSKRPLLGSDATEAGVIWNLTMEVNDYLRKACDDLVRPIFFNNLTEVNDQIERAARVMDQELLVLEKSLERHAFLTGESPSAADAVAFPEVRILKRAMDTKTEVMRDLGYVSLVDRYPNVVRWMALVEGMEFYERSFPYHWENQ